MQARFGERLVVRVGITSGIVVMAAVEGDAAAPTRPARPRDGNTLAVRLPRIDAAIIADIGSAIRPDGGTVRAAGQMRHHRGLLPRMHARERLAFDLHEQDRTVLHGDRPFRKAKPIRDRLEIQRHPPCSL